MSKALTALSPDDFPAQADETGASISLEVPNPAMPDLWFSELSRPLEKVKAMLSPMCSNAACVMRAGFGNQQQGIRIPDLD